MDDSTSLAADLSAAMSGGSTTSASESAASAETTSAPIEGSPTTQAAPVSSPSENVRQTQGPIPFDVHTRSMENARTKAVEEYRQRFGWAESVDQQEFQKAANFYRHFAGGGDVVEGLKNFLTEIRKDPAVDAQLRSLHAKELAALRGHATTQGQPAEPQMVAVQLEDGSVVSLPRDPGAWLAQQKQQWMEEVRRELAPVTKTFDQITAERAEAVRQHQIDHFTTNTFNKVLTWRGMESDESKRLVAEDLQRRTDIDPNDPRDVLLATQDAYFRLILPKFDVSARQAAISDITQKATNANTVSPNRPTSGTPRKDSEKSMSELFREEMAARAGR